jgi:hypothetical protein
LNGEADESNDGTIGTLPFINKVPIRRIVAEQNAQVGFVPDATATAERAQAMTRALGIPPEANLLSSGIIAAREAE